MGAFESGGTPVAEPLPQIPTNVLASFSITGGAKGTNGTNGTNAVVLAWPVGYTNLYLQFATNVLSSNTVWTLAPGTVSTNNGSNNLVFSTTNSSRQRAFFRLFGLTNLASSNLVGSSVTVTNSGPPAP